MSQLYLPAAHTESDLVLAGWIAERIESAELYVAWTPSEGRAAPEVPAVLRAPTPQWTDTLALVLGAVRELWTALFARQEPNAPLQSPAEPRPSQPAPGEAAA